jgi:hypothetical protein
MQIKVICTPFVFVGYHVAAGFYSGGVGVSSMGCYASVVHVPM